MNNHRNDKELKSLQAAVCKKYAQSCMIPSADSKLGFALSTTGDIPINGLRHPPKGDTNGWYIWCGKELSTAPDFFSPLHTVHLKERCPEVLQYLGLPPGFRFLVAGAHVDVWYDASLLHM
ncbi:MAG: hypothetical protein WA628_05615, partial [Terriglobales bacterium]